MWFRAVAHIALTLIISILNIRVRTRVCACILIVAFAFFSVLGYACVFVFAVVFMLCNTSRTTWGEQDSAQTGPIWVEFGVRRPKVTLKYPCEHFSTILFECFFRFCARTRKECTVRLSVVFAAMRTALRPTRRRMDDEGHCVAF